MKEFLDVYGDLVVACVGSIIVLAAAFLLFNYGGTFSTILISALNKAV